MDDLFERRRDDDSPNMLAQSVDELFARAHAYRSSREYLETLRFINRFPRHAPYNAFLIGVQNPAASFVASARTWAKSYRRRVKPDARPLVVLFPFGPVAFEYDVTDTEGEDLPHDALEPFAARGHLSPTVWRNTLAHCRRLEIPLQYERLSRQQAGVAVAELDRHAPRDPRGPLPEPSVAAFHIGLNEDLPPEAMYATLVHELAHILCGHLGKRENDRWADERRLPRELRELEAESVSFLVCSRLGIDGGAARYLAAFVDREPQLPRLSLHVVLRVANEVWSMGKRPPAPERRPSGASAPMPRGGEQIALFEDGPS